MCHWSPGQGKLFKVDKVDATSIRPMFRLQPTLFKQAVELGATCTPAFTDRVTHLVAVDHGGAKYMVCNLRTFSALSQCTPVCARTQNTYC